MPEDLQIAIDSEIISSKYNSIKECL